MDVEFIKEIGIIGQIRDWIEAVLIWLYWNDSGTAFSIIKAVAREQSDKKQKWLEE